MDVLTKEEAHLTYLNFKKNPDNIKNLADHMTGLVIKSLDNEHFKKNLMLSDCSSIAAAQYLSIIAYPKENQTDKEKQLKFSRAMISALLFENGLPTAKEAHGKEVVERLIDEFCLMKLPKDYERTISGGISRLQKRLFVYHACRRHDDYLLRAPSEDKRSFYDILYQTAVSYKGLGINGYARKYEDYLQDKTIHKDSFKTLKQHWSDTHPVLHLLYGYDEHHLQNYALDSRHIRNAIVSPDWVKNAIAHSQFKLACDLLDEEMLEAGAPRHTNLEFTTSRAIFLDDLSSPFINRGIIPV